MKSLLLKLLLSVVAVFAPIQSVLFAAFAMIMVDLATGVLAARKRGEKLTSAGLQRTLVKLFVYEGALLLGYVSQHYLMLDAVNVVSIIGSYISLTELVSCYENIDAVAGGSLLKQISDKLKSKNS